MPHTVFTARRGMTLTELLAVIAIIGLLMALLLPAVQSVRESSRQTACSNNLKQVSQGVLGFERAFGRFPALAWDWNLRDMLANEGKANTHDWERIGPLFLILPFMEKLALYDESIRDWINKTPANPPARVPFDVMFKGGEVASFLCPSDPVRPPWTFGNSGKDKNLTSYHVCDGDTFGGYNVNPRFLKRGVFRYGKVGDPTSSSSPEQKLVTTMAHVLDGISNTVMLGEVAIMDGTDRLPGGVGSLPAPLSQGNNSTGTGGDLPTVCLALVNGSGRYSVPQVGIGGGQPGWVWHDGWPRATAFSTITAPNKPRCGGGGASVGSGNSEQIVPASSRHVGGAFVSFCDGSIRWVGNDIDDRPASPNFAVYARGPSNFGLWGALGTIAGGELMNHVW